MTVRNRGRGGKPRWYADFEIRGTRYRPSIPEARTKADALEAENALRRQVFDGTYGTPRLGAQLFTEFVAQTYTPWAETNKSTAGKEQYIVDQLCVAFKGKKLRDVSPLMIEKLKREVAGQTTKRGGERAPASVNMVLSVGSRIFTLAVDLEQAARNPFRKVKKLAVDDQQFRYLSWEEERRLIEAVVNPAVSVRSPRRKSGSHSAEAQCSNLTLSSLTLLETNGCETTSVATARKPSCYSRISKTTVAVGASSFRKLQKELSNASTRNTVHLKAAQRAHLRDAIPIAIGTGLRRGEQTRLQAKHCDFARNLIVVEHTKTNPTKTKRLREVPMNDDVRAILRRLCQVKRPDEFLFVNPITKRPYKDFKTGFGATCAEAGINNLSWKALRHTFGTRLGEAGYNAFEIAALMGHSDVRTTMRYVHATDRRKHEAVQSTMLSRRATA